MAETRVIHYRDRAQYDPDECVYIGRRMPRQGLQGSTFGNPYVIGKDGTREEVLAKYRAWLTGRLEENRALCDELMELSGKVLFCWCCPKEGFQGRLLCHGQILAEFAERLAAERSSDE